MTMETHYCFTGGAVMGLPGVWPGGCAIQVEDGRVVALLSLADGSPLPLPSWVEGAPQKVEPEMDVLTQVMSSPPPFSSSAAAPASSARARAKTGATAPAAESALFPPAALAAGGTEPVVVDEGRPS